MKRLLSLLLVSMFGLQSLAQDTEPPLPPSQNNEKPKEPFKDRLFLSPVLGLQFGTVTVINISPKIGYRITDKFASGLGATYVYVKDNTFKSYGYTYESNIYGGSVFSQYQVLEQVRLYAEYELLSLETFNSTNFDISRRLVPSLLAGGGYTSPIGANSSMQLMVLFDLIESPYSIYQNPVIRVGFNLGL